MSHADFLVFIFRQQCEVSRWDDLSEDALGPLIPCFLLILYREVLADESGGHFYDLDHLVLQN